jgi:glutamate decarboxylase
MHPDDVAEHIDENTIAVGAVLGTTFIGENDPISELNDLLVGVKKDKGWDIPLHVDGASGGFVAPFSNPDELWDFRLEQVASINASGHKYGLVYPGVGWLLFRDRSKLPEELVFNVNYLGGAQPTFTFNFSRASAMIQAQYYNFIRLGRAGYRGVVANMMANARHLNEHLVKSGRFEILNPGLAEPVVTFRLKGSPGYDEYHVADRLRMNGWIVPAYTLPPNAEDVTVLRVVVRNDMSRDKIDILLHHIETACAYLEGKPPPPTELERKTHEKQRSRC